MPHDTNTPTIGSLFAGIGGFDLGFEQAGWKTKWQVEINEINRAVLADRFPHSRQYADVRDFVPTKADHVEAIAGGFPCQDISNNGAKRKAGRLGLKGARSGLFFEAMRIVREIQPRWLVLENVEALRFSNQGRDFATVLQVLRDCGYLGLWRVLDAQHFGSPCRRRRLFVVAGHQKPPPPWTCWLMPHQWQLYLARCLRSNSHATRTHGLGILYKRRTLPRESFWAVNYSWLRRTDGVRWLSGEESLSAMGFRPDWMTPTLRKNSVRETPSILRVRSGSQKN